MTRGRRTVAVALGLLALALAGPAAQPGPRLAFIYTGGESTGPVEIRRAVEPLGIATVLFAPGPGGTPLTPDTDLGQFDVVFVDGSVSSLEPMRSQLEAAALRTRVVIVTPGMTVPGQIPLEGHPDIARYWQNASQDNYAGLAQYLLVRVAGRPWTRPVPSPIVYAAFGFHHPDLPQLLPSLEAYLSWEASRAGRDALALRPSGERLTVGIFAHRATYQQKNMAAVDALVRDVERRGHRAVTLVGLSDTDFPRALAGADGRPGIDVFLYSGEALHLRDREVGIARARALGVPILGAFNWHTGRLADYLASPTGLHPALTSQVVQSEREGRIEPLVISARGPDRDGRTFNEPMAAQVEWRMDRALAWARLHRLPNREKRVVFTYWSEGGGKANVGGDPDDFLDVPASLVSLLHAMQREGYDVGTQPLPDRDALVRRMSREASNVGTWAPAELARRVRESDVVLIPEQRYLQWFRRLPRANQDAITEMWGPPPGQIMVHTAASGQRFLVIPVIQFGRVLVAPHPDWGYLQSRQALMSVGALPPHHQYLAFFLWLQQDWRADAWVSLFTNIVLQPGKNEGPVASDHIAQLLGPLPHIHPERLGSGGGIGNKRKAMAQTIGWYNLVSPSDTRSETGELRAQLLRYASQVDDDWRRGAQGTIRAEIARTGIARALGLDPDAADFERLRSETQRYLDDLDRATAPHGTRVLGEIPGEAVLADMVTGMLGPDFRAAVAVHSESPGTTARAIVRRHVVGGVDARVAVREELGTASAAVEAALEPAREYARRLRAAPEEIAGILRALGGAWIEPGPMDEPMRDPDAVPPGRSLYNFDQAAMPTPEAEAIGIMQANALIAQYRDSHDGAYPTQLAFVVWSDIVKTHGATEAQMLHLLGTRPVRNSRGEVTGVSLIPRAELGRPRVDVLATTSGTYRDHFQDKVALLAEAIRLAASSPESDNPVAAGVRAAEAKLRAAGESAERAAALAQARVFSPAPGAYSPSIQFLAKSGDQRGDESRMAELFTSRMSHAYGAGIYGEPARAAYESNLGRTNAATLPRSSSVNGMLDHPMSAGFLGGMNLAAKAVTGRDIDLYVSNLRDPSEPRMESAARALQVELRTRYLNEGWLREMQAHGYDGARNLMFMTDHLDLWDTTATQMVSSADWQEVKDVIVDDRFKLGMDRFFDTHNPHAQQVLLANLLGAARRGQWNATAADLSQVATRLAESASAHGAVCEATICRNPELTAYVAEAMAGRPDAATLLQAYQAAIAAAVGGSAPAPGTSSSGAPAPATAGTTVRGASVAPPSPAPASSASSTVTGRVLEDVTQTLSGVVASHPWAVGGLALTMALLVVAGWFRESGR
jgi:cobaltochelatase CobN